MTKIKAVVGTNQDTYNDELSEYYVLHDDDSWRKLE